MINRRLLQFWFTLDEFPALTCPRCRSGSLNHEEKPKIIEPPYSTNARSFFEWEPEWTEYRLADVLVCSNSSCGEIVMYSADGSVDWDIDEYGKQKYNKYFKFQAFHPAPWIIDLPENLPEPIKLPLLASFDAYWKNKQLCANATRQAIEGLLDYHGIERLSEKGKRIPLGARIDLLEKTKPEFSELFELFRPFLNAGSHGESVETDSLINVLEALEIHLAQVFDDKSDRLKELKILLKKSTATS